MRPSMKLSAALGHLNSFSSTAQYNGSTEHDMTTLLTGKMFRNYNLSLVRRHTVNQSLFSIYVHTGTALGCYVTLQWVKDGEPRTKAYYSFRTSGSTK